MTETAEMISPAGVANSSAVVHPAGTVALSRTASVGFTCILGRDMATSQDFATWTCGARLTPRFLLYALRGHPEQIALRKAGSTHKTIYMPDIETLAVPLPPLAEQRAIADFLDAETARIDALITAERRMIDLLEVRLRNLARAEFASNDQRLPLRRVVDAVRTGTTPNADLLTVATDGPAVEWISPGDFGAKLELTRAVRSLPLSTASAAGLPIVPAGAVAVVGIGATAGKVAFVDREVCSNQQVTCLTPKKEMLGRFLAWQLWARSDEIRAVAPYTTLPILNNDFLKGLPIVAPSLDAQHGVVARLDGLLQRSRQVTELLSVQIDLLIEHRQALITAAVTGELEVPGVAA